MGILNAYIPVYCRYCTVSKNVPVVLQPLKYYTSDELNLMSLQNLMSQLPRQILYIDSCLCAEWLHVRNLFCRVSDDVLGVTWECMQ